MGKTRIEARRYRIFQLSTYDCLTDDERTLYDTYNECSDKSKKKKFKLEDEFSDCFYELMHIESMYLYKQGFKDCYKIIQLLERD